MGHDRLEVLERTIAALAVDAAVERLQATGGTGHQTVQDLVDIASRRAHSDTAAARHALDVGDRLAAEVDCSDVVPASRYLRARIVLNSGHPDEALGLIAEARSEWLALGRPLDAYRTDLGRMHVLDDLGRHGEAVALSERLLEDLDLLDRDGLPPQDREQSDWIRAAANENLGVACGFTGQHERALEAYRQAEERYRAVGGDDDMARCRANRGVELVAVGRAVEGLEVLQSAAAMFQELDDRLSYAQCLGHVADAELLLGLYAAALTRYEEARSLLDGLEARSEGCRIRLRTVRAYLALNLVDEAEALATQTEQDLTELALRHDLAEARWLCGVAQLRAGRAEQALDRLGQAIDEALESDDPPLVVKILLARSEALDDIGDRAAAQADADRALTVVAGGHWPTEELHVLLRLAQLSTDAELVDSHLQRAERLVDELGLPHLRYPVLLELGRHLQRQGVEDEARRTFQAAVEVVEGLRGLIPDEALRTSYLEGRTAAHMDLMSMLIAGGDPRDRLSAFDLAEASKARTLDDILSGVVQPGAVGAEPAADPSPQPLLQRYEADLHAAYSALSTGDVTMTRRHRRAVQDRAVELERAIRLAHLQAATKRGSGDGRTGAGRSMVRPSATERVVEYHVVGDQIVAFVWVDAELSVVVAETPASKVWDLLAQWDRSRQRFEVAQQLNTGGAHQLLSAAEDVLRQLWIALYAPLERSLGSVRKSDEDGLLVVPHGPLHAVPFHALIGPDGPVGREQTITVALSYAVANRLRGAAGRAIGDSLVVGVPDSSAPAVTEEARFVAGMLPGAELLLGDEATIEAVMAALETPRDVLHLACHGLHRARNPMFSALKLADGWLTAKDVLKLQLDRTLVVLSACETGRQGEGGSQGEAVGLARSFLAAGASAVVVSLWLAGDVVTAELMHHFYTEFRSGRRPAAALRSAQADVADTHPHPAAWAPFVIHGGGEGEQ